MVAPRRVKTKNSFSQILTLLINFTRHTRSKIQHQGLKFSDYYQTIFVLCPSGGRNFLNNSWHYHTNVKADNKNKHNIIIVAFVLWNSFFSINIHKEVHAKQCGLQTENESHKLWEKRGEKVTHRVFVRNAQLFLFIFVMSWLLSQVWFARKFFRFSGLTTEKFDHKKYNTIEFERIKDNI